MGLFDFNANEPLSYEALQTRRKIAEQIAGRRAQPYPKNVGEGIASAAESLTDAYGQRSLEAKLAAYDKFRRGEINQTPAAASPGVPLPTARPAPTPRPPGAVRRSDLDPAAPIDPAAQPNSLYAGSPPMGETFNMANYDPSRPEDYVYG